MTRLSWGRFNGNRAAHKWLRRFGVVGWRRRLSRLQALLVFTVMMCARCNNLLQDPAAPAFDDGVAFVGRSQGTWPSWEEGPEKQTGRRMCGEQACAAGAALASSSGAYGATADIPAAELQESKVKNIIHVAAAFAALADGALAQAPGVGGVLVIPTIQAAMIYIIAQTYGCHLSRGSAMIVLNFVISNQMSQQMFKFGTELIGWVPVVGNVVKFGTTFMLTEGIGQAADKLLSCGPGGDFMDVFLKNISEEELARLRPNKTDEHDWQIFHLVTEYLANPSLGAREVWQRARHFLSLEDQQYMLSRVREAASPQELDQLLHQYAWNLVVVEEVLKVLSERFPTTESCAAVGFVTEQFWSREPLSDEVRSAVAPYLLRCAQHADATTRSAMVQTASKLLVTTKGGTRMEMLPAVIRAALHLLQELALKLAGCMDRIDIPEVLTSVMLATIHGHAAAGCSALLELLRTEEELPAASWASVRHLAELDRLLSDGRRLVEAELCVPALRKQIAGNLALHQWPETTERPSSQVAEAEAWRSTQMTSPLEERLSATVVGQHCALQRLARYVGLKKRGMWSTDKPLVVLLTGPSGTGKTLLARKVAEELHGRPIIELEHAGRFRTFQMNLFSLKEDQKSFFGPPRGVAGGPGDLPELLRRWPDAVVLLDEVEKAHPSFARALLYVFGENGAVYDAKTGEDVSTVRATFILTSNLGKDVALAHRAASVKDDPTCTAYAELREDVQVAMQQPLVAGLPNFFRESEVRARLTDALPFLPFNLEEVELAVRKFLAEEAKSFATAKQFMRVSLGWSSEVVQELAAAYTRRREEGLRGIHTQLQTRVREALESAIDVGLVKHGDGVLLRVYPHGKDVSDRRLDIRVVLGLQSTPQQSFSWWGRSVKTSQADTPRHRSTDTTSRSSYSFGDWGTNGAFWSLQGDGSSFEPWEWEQLHDWDWQAMWQWLLDFLWEWRLELLVASVCVIVASYVVLPSTAAQVPAAFAAAPGLAAASAPYLGAAAPTASLIPSIGALFVQTAASSLGSTVGYVVMPTLALALLWNQRHLLAMLACSFVLFPLGIRILRWYICRRYFREAPHQQPARHISTRFSSPPPSKNPRRQSSPASYSYLSPTLDEDIMWLRTLPGDADSKEAFTADDLAHEVPVVDDELLED